MANSGAVQPCDTNPAIGRVSRIVVGIWTLIQSLAARSGEIDMPGTPFGFPICAMRDDSPLANAPDGA